MTVTLVVPHAASSAAAVRHRISSDVAGSRYPPRVVDDLALLLTELVGNAVRHAEPLPGNVIEVYWAIGPDQVLLRVTDGGSHTFPHRRTVGVGATRGRGLAIVEMLAREWGVDVEARGTTVWAVLPCTASSAPALSGSRFS